MTRFIVITALLSFAAMALVTPSLAGDKGDKNNPVVIMETSKGVMTIELYEKEAPLTVQNFLWYVDHGFYDGLIFHRVIEDFMIQGGGFTAEMKKKQGNPAIENEATNGLSNEKYTIAMARTNDINSATSQFFINSKDNPALDHVNKDRFGYCVFGKVIDGQKVVDKISVVATTTKNGMKDVPVQPVIIEKVYRAGEKGSAEKKKSE